jgi:hypothetical protein
VYNYAFSGATIDNNLTSYNQAIPSVTQQVRDVLCLRGKHQCLTFLEQTGTFLQYHAPGKPLFPGWKSDNTLFSIWIGINDIGTTYSNAGEDA